MLLDWCIRIDVWYSPSPCGTGGFPWLCFGKWSYSRGTGHFSYGLSRGRVGSSRGCLRQSGSFCNCRRHLQQGGGCCCCCEVFLVGNYRSQWSWVCTVSHLVVCKVMVLKNAWVKWPNSCGSELSLYVARICSSICCSICYIGYAELFL